MKSYSSHVGANQEEGVDRIKKNGQRESSGSECISPSQILKQKMSLFSSNTREIRVGIQASGFTRGK